MSHPPHTDSAGDASDADVRARLAALPDADLMRVLDAREIEALREEK